jgi:lipopolysaccharide export system permease protein
MGFSSFAGCFGCYSRSDTLEKADEQVDRMKIKTIYKYVMGKFWGPFFFGLGIFAVLVFLADLFDHLKYILKSSASLWVVIKYFVFVVPFWTSMAVPVAALLAALFVLSEMIQNGEWVASIGSGYHPKQIYLPIIFCAVLVAMVNFIFQETVGPHMHLKSEEIFSVEIKGNKHLDKYVRDNVVVMSGENRFISAKLFDIRNGIMERAVLSFQKEGKIVFQVDAESANWDVESGLWVFNNGVTRDLSQKKLVETPFEKWTSTIDIKPQDLYIERAWPEDLTIRDILKRIKHKRKIGYPYTSEQAYLHTKLAAPFAAIIMCMLGIPFAIIVKRASKMIHFASAIFIAFVFWWLISISQAAGEAGMLNPILAAWLPIAVFGTIGYLGLKKAGLR